MNKILIIAVSERAELEQALQPVVQEGGELLFAGRKEDALEIMKREQPQVILVDAEVVAEWEHEGNVVWIFPRGKGKEGSLSKPVKPHQVLEKCRPFLAPETAVQVPPM